MKRILDQIMRIFLICVAVYVAMFVGVDYLRSVGTQSYLLSYFLPGAELAIPNKYFMFTSNIAQLDSGCYVRITTSPIPYNCRINRGWLYVGRDTSEGTSADGSRRLWLYATQRQDSVSRDSLRLVADTIAISDSTMLRFTAINNDSIIRRGNHLLMFGWDTSNYFLNTSSLTNIGITLELEIVENPN